jgi:hypothetical protein
MMDSILIGREFSFAMLPSDASMMSGLGGNESFERWLVGRLSASNILEHTGPQCRFVSLLWPCLCVPLRPRDGIRKSSWPEARGCRQ